MVKPCIVNQMWKKVCQKCTTLPPSPDPDLPMPAFIAGCPMPAPMPPSPVFMPPPIMPAAADICVLPAIFKGLQSPGMQRKLMRGQPVAYPGWVPQAEHRDAPHPDENSRRDLYARQAINETYERHGQSAHRSIKAWPKHIYLKVKTAWPNLQRNTEPFTISPQKLATMFAITEKR